MHCTSFSSIEALFRLVLYCTSFYTFSLFILLSDRVAMSKRRSYVTLTVEQKLAIVCEAEKAPKKGDVAKKYGISARTLSTFIKSKRKLEEKVDEGGGKKKRLRKLEYPDIDNAVFQWFKEMRTQNIPIGGPILQGKAQRFAAALHHTISKLAAVG